MAWLVIYTGFMYAKCRNPFGTLDSNDINIPREQARTIGIAARYFGTVHTLVRAVTTAPAFRPNGRVYLLYSSELISSQHVAVGRLVNARAKCLHACNDA